MRKRIIILSISLFFFGGYFIQVSGNSYRTSIPAIQQQNENDQKKVEIRFDELPQIVKDAFLGSEYKDWSVISVYKLKDTKGGDYYQFNLKKASETKLINFDSNGKRLTDVDEVKY